MKTSSVNDALKSDINESATYLYETVVIGCVHPHAVVGIMGIVVGSKGMRCMFPDIGKVYIVSLSVVVS
jgi:hypothetical protein